MTNLYLVLMTITLT